MYIVPTLITAVGLTSLLYLLISSILRYFLINKRLLGGKRGIMFERTLEAKMMIKKATTKSKGLMPKLETWLTEASINMEAGRFARMSLTFCLTVPVFAFIVTGVPWISFALLLAVPLVIYFRVDYLRKKKLRDLIAQLPDVANFLSSSLKSGYSLMQALNMVIEEGSPPSSLEFKRVLQDINLGKPYEEAFGKMIERNPAQDIEILVTGIIINKETGGNLAQIMDTISNTIREREKLSGEIKSLTAQGRLSGFILTLLPIGIFLFLAMFNPDYIRPMFTHPMGKMLLLAYVFTQLLGALFIRRIIRIDW